ncbi:hypothetical protein GIB67_023388 [Kingdonia uniflora]|uniref:Ribulose bisphosphate carboxylase/oxygenase activase, chloroplastic n=1 Tax=Kingdonia uniflora TaxID=39325 RepID=A0A7J7LI93_9MAGN|nr:hypothetical protein GIB67_023388 [Kingdonia uniflora]
MSLCSFNADLIISSSHHRSSTRSNNTLSRLHHLFSPPIKINPPISLCSKGTHDNNEVSKKKISKQSSWETKDSEGKDYLYRLGKEADNMNISVGARAGVIDDLFVGKFLGRDSCHIVKNYIAHLLNVKVPLILGIWGGKGQGKSFQTELIFQAMGVEPVIMSAGELESDRAGEPGRLIRDRYRTASQVIQNKVRSLLTFTFDIRNTQMTVNNQIVVGTLMNLCDNPTRVSIGQNWRESDITHRVPVIVTGNDLSTLYAPLIRDGRMDKFYWQPTHEDIINIVHRMYERDGIPRDAVWVKDIGGFENLGLTLLKRKRNNELPTFIPPKQTAEALLESGYSLLKEQQLIMENKLSKEYMKNME